MALIGAAAILVANGGANRPRGPNIHREGCISTESDRTSVRLDRNEVGVNTGITPDQNFGVKPVLHRSLTPNLIRRSV